LIFGLVDFEYLANAHFSLIGRPPLWYAMLQDSGTMAEALLANGATQLRYTPTREQSAILLWPEIGFSPDLDAQEVSKAITQETLVPAEPQVDHKANIPNSVVYQKDGDIYDVLLTIVDVKQGMFGTNNFYKMVRLFMVSFATQHLFFLTLCTANYTRESEKHVHSLHTLGKNRPTRSNSTVRFLLL